MDYSKCFLWICLLGVSSAWPQLGTTLAGSLGFMRGFLQPRTWSTPASSSVAILTASETPAKPSTMEVKHLTSVSYNGLNYIMVKNTSLDFAEAERYCLEEFTDPMHLVSVQSEEEWKMLTKYFGTEYPREMWLGGSVRRTTSRLFVLSWIDGLKFAYHRFPNTERKRWQSNWRLNSQGCIVANMQSDGLGSWTAELTPCSEPRQFVCKESEQQPRQQHESAQTHNVLMPHLLDFSTLVRSVLARPLFLSPVVPAVHTESHKFERPVDHMIRAPLSTTTVKPVTSVVQPDSIAATMNATTATSVQDQSAQEWEVTTSPISTTENSMVSETSEAEKPSSTATTVATPVSQAIRREPRKATFKVFPATENAKKRVRPSSTNASYLPSLPKIAAQMIYPQTVWDLTHPEEPKWLSEKVE